MNEVAHLTGLIECNITAVNMDISETYHFAVKTLTHDFSRVLMRHIDYKCWIAS